MEKLKAKWGIQSNSQLIIILLVFAITGSTSVIITTPLFHFFGIDKENINFFIYYILKIVILFPVYICLLVGFGFIAGQYKFFYEFAKKMLSGIGLGMFFKK
jgi:manganese efflux pump family protein